jgi:phage gp46-like protein
MYKPLISHMQPASVQCKAVNTFNGTLSLEILKPEKQYKFQLQHQLTVKIY